MNGIEQDAPAAVQLKRLRQGVFSEELAFTAGDDSRCRLRPVRVDREDAELLARWRSHNREAFFSWVTLSAEEVMRWLESYAARPDDVLFFVLDPNGRPVGQMGLYDIDFRSRRAEFGRVIRGEAAPPGCMTGALRKVLDIAAAMLGLQEVHLEVFENNERAVQLYRRCGFETSGRILYEMTFDERDGVRWQPSMTADEHGTEKEHRWVLRMTKQM